MIKKHHIILTAAVGAGLAVAGLKNTLSITEYLIKSEKIKRPLNLVYLSDIHSQKYKDEGTSLIEKIAEADPDCILLGGDIFDKYSNEKRIERTFILVEKIQKTFGEVFYASGNHELEGGQKDCIAERLRGLGIKVLGEEIYEFTARSEQKILIGGIDFVSWDMSCSESTEQRDKLIKKAEESGLFSVLLRHVPTVEEGDSKLDLILSGHNHGGLWRIPKTNFGVAGGGKKLFPKYVHGEYKVNGTTLIVGSGITTETYLLPRIYNVPEVVKIKIQPLTTLVLCERIVLNEKLQ